MNIVKYRYYSKFGIIIDNTVTYYTEKTSLQDLINEIAVLFAYDKQIKTVKIIDCILQQRIFSYSREE